MNFDWRDDAVNKEEETKTQRDLIVVDTFSDLEIDEKLKASLAKNNYTQMTKIQKLSIPVILQNNNVLVKSETGSGKTL
jgi:superfamily II DNA/RNA helicase